MRQELIDDFYANHYDEVFWSGFPGIGMRKTHRDIESKFKKEDIFSTVCEVGSGQGRHLPFVRHAFEKYIMVDIRPINLKTSDNRIETLQADATSLPLNENSVDRLLGMCLLPHLSDPGAALEEWRRVVKNQGQISIFLSCDPGLLIRINRKLIMNRIMKKRGFNEYILLNALEHRNHFASLAQMVFETFKNDTLSIKRYPINFIQSWNFNAYWIIQIKVKK
jgi:ubiquinone/menaquinone biosynthesis C-methylase UbiE